MGLSRFLSLPWLGARPIHFLPGQRVQAVARRSSRVCKEPRITQILMGIVQVAFGIILNLANGYQLIAIHVGTPFWTGILYILSGFICVTAAKNPKISLVKAMLAMNTLSAIVAGVGIALYSLSLIFYYPHGTCQWIEESKSCAPTSRVPADTMSGVATILLVFTILEFCVSISSAAFGCKTLCRDSYGDTVTASVRGDRGLGFRVRGDLSEHGAPSCPHQRPPQSPTPLPGHPDPLSRAPRQPPADPNYCELLPALQWPPGGSAASGPAPWMVTTGTRS
ncbi:membrane-spanning 4-domains subfamily A member 8-like isoform X2 [Trachemys scripta elegans]|uniref:membrane-spanning 4-domains subfamily A member 8-like isoform X2 n=1 Tax=Trachemys scripta elegans TaxID=31138 RepID=UPI001555D6C6|nr:membrane-spanning 4-domains subfamily A member 8-like isoform X2 [Trachemys scripta elegans]